MKKYLLLTSLIVAAFITSPAFAEPITTDVGIKPSLTVTIPSTPLVLNLNPATATYGSQNLTITVGTNNETGYKMTITTPSDDTNLIHTEESSLTIPTLATGTSYANVADFPANFWGYKKDSNNFIPFVSGAVILENPTRANDDTATFTFGSKIDYLKDSGTYATTFTFTTIANPICNTTITGTMQEFDPCPDMAVGTTGTLTDARDGKSYTVAKLADGQIWMTSNLNLAGGTALDSTNTDITDAYITNFGTAVSGLTVNATNKTITLPNSSTSGFSDDTVAYVYNSGNNTTNCADGVPCNSYYSWLAATVGGKDANGTAVTGNGYNAAYSICPAGWRLPTVTTSNAPAQTSPNWKTGDFYKLATAYGANLESSSSQSSAVFYNNAGPGTLPGFLLAGYYYSSTFYSGGSSGLYWSSTSGSSSYAYYLSFGSSSVRSAYNNARKNGRSVRCIFNQS